MTVNIGRKEMVFFGVIILVFVVAGLAIAYGGSSPAVMGHSLGEIQTCVDGQILKMSGGIWTCAAESGGAGGSAFVPSSYTGQESVILPNGLIMKMGYKATTDTSGTVTFGGGTPNPFPNGVVSITITERGSIGHFEESIISSQDKNGFSWTTYAMTDKTGFNWVAIGY